MKNRKWLYCVLIALTLVVYFGYRALDRIRTDTKAPEIHISEASLQVSVLDPKSALLQGVTATDDTDGDITASLLVESIRLLDSEGTISVTYAAFDRSGNVAKAEREIQYTDYESPKFRLNRPLIFDRGTSFDVLDIIGADDMIDGDISHRIRATSIDNESIATFGTHDVEFRVTNSLGDTMKLILPVEVYSSGAYQASLSLTDYLVYVDTGASFNARSYLDSFTLNQKITSLREGLPADFSVQTSGEVDTQTPGVYTVAYKVTYKVVNENNPNLSQSYTGYSKLIVVVEG